MSTQKCLSDVELGRLVEDEVTPEEKQVLQQHIQTCPDCKKRWQLVSEGSQRVKQLFSKAAGQISAMGRCLSKDLLTDYINQTLNSEQKQEVEDHLTMCSHCRDAFADIISDAYMTDGENWWSEYAGQQILCLLARLSEHQVGDILKTLKVTSATTVEAKEVIKLPLLEPVQGDTRRLAAATGDGLYEQTLHQDSPPFDFHIVQFGKQIRISIKATGKDRSFENCLGMLQFSEKDICKYSELILVDKGVAKCILSPDIAATLKPEIEHIKIRFTPIVTLTELSSAGTDAYKPILSKLLQHQDPEIRKDATKVVLRIFGLEARPLLEPLLEDTDAAVRQTVEKILQQLSQSTS